MATQKLIMPDGGPPYRVGVGAVLFNRDGLVFYGERMDTRDAWQWPQGGLDEGEDAQTAAARELQEEIGVEARHIELIATYPGQTFYDFPDVLANKNMKAKYRGQAQHWYAYRFLGKDGDIRLDHHHEVEFRRWRWGKLSEGPGLIVPFKRGVYEKVARAFASYAAL